VDGSECMQIMQMRNKKRGIRRCMHQRHAYCRIYAYLPIPDALKPPKGRAASKVS
jgi:hypothetical protein